MSTHIFKHWETERNLLQEAVNWTVAVSNKGAAPVPTDRLVGHAHITGGPTTKSTCQIIGLLHGRFSGVIRKRCRYVSGSSGQGMHATWAVKAVGTPWAQRKTHCQKHCSVPLSIPFKIIFGSFYLQG